MSIVSMDRDRHFLTKRFSKQLTVIAGTVSDVILVDVKRLTISVYPVSGGTVKVEVSISPMADIRDELSNVKWIDWALGDVTVDSSDVALGLINAVRFTATAQNAVCEITG